MKNHRASILLFNFYGIEITFTHLLALCALLLTFFQAHRLIKHQRISVKPLLDSWQHASDNEINLRIANKGLGTAEIAAFSFLINGEELTKSTLKQVVSEVAPNTDFGSHIAEVFAVKSYMAKDEEVELLKINFNERVIIDEIAAHLEKCITLDINYKSLYGETYDFNIRNGRHTHT